MTQEIKAPSLAEIEVIELRARELRAEAIAEGVHAVKQWFERLLPSTVVYEPS